MLRFYGVARDAAISEEDAQVLLVNAAAEKFGEDPLRELERALPKAVNELKGKKEAISKLYGASTRITNQLYGADACPEWKCWPVSKALLNAANHFHGGDAGHLHCGRFLLTSCCLKQQRGPASLRSAEVAVSWARFDSSKSLPAGISQLSQLLLETFVLSSAVQTRIFSTISFLRSSMNEVWSLSIHLSQFTCAIRSIGSSH